jgi:hypothetical protein
MANSERQTIERDVDEIIDALRTKMQRMRAEIEVMRPVVEDAGRYISAQDLLNMTPLGHPGRCAALDRRNEAYSSLVSAYRRCEP